MKTTGLFFLRHIIWLSRQCFQDLERGLFSCRIGSVPLLLPFALPGGRVESMHHQLEMCPLPLLVLLSLTVAPSCHYGALVTHILIWRLLMGQSIHRMSAQTYEQLDNECDIETLKLCVQTAPACPNPRSCWELASRFGLSYRSTSLQWVCCSPAPAGMPWSALLSSSLKNKEINPFFFPRSFHLFPFYLTSTSWLLFWYIWPLWPLLTRSLS